MEYFYGIVEDRQDPLKVGRVRVRIHGIHTDDKLLIATAEDFPTGDFTEKVQWQLGQRLMNIACSRWGSRVRATPQRDGQQDAEGCEIGRDVGFGIGPREPKRARLNRVK